MGKKPQFAAMPKRAIGDPELTDRDFRCLASVAAFDRMSSVRGTGQGAWASHATMALMVGAEYSRFSVAINKLLKLGYLIREPLATDRRKFTYRIIYGDGDHLPPGKPMADDGTVCPPANDFAEIVCRSDAEAPEIVCSDPSLSNCSERESFTQYISLREGIDSVETGERDSVETARLSPRRLGMKSKKWLSDNDGAKLAIFEREWKSDNLTNEQLLEVHGWLQGLADDPNPDDPTSQRAQRLYYSVDMALWELGLINQDDAA